MMAPRVDAVAVAYHNIQRFPAGHELKKHITGNPVRDEIVAIRDDGFPPLPEDGIFRLLAVGGRLGATVLSEVDRMSAVSGHSLSGRVDLSGHLTLQQNTTD